MELGSLLPVRDPAIGQVVRWVHEAEGPQIVQALASAVTAQAAWAATPPAQRAQVLRRFATLVAQDRDRIAAMLTAEQGKTAPEALAEVQRGLSFVDYACGIPALLGGEYHAQVAEGVDHWTQSQALGVVLGVAPFNDAFAVPLWMAPLALACGNAFVLKPSPLTPSVSIWMAEAWLRAGLPPALFQVLQGGPSVVNGLLQHPDVVALSAVGSTEVARALYAKAAELGKRVQALGGAKNHLVVMPDADMEAVCDALLEAAYGAAGALDLGVSVVVPVGGAGDALMPRLTERVRRLRVGNGLHDGVQVGPLISAEAKERVVHLIRSGELDGAQLLVDGRGCQVAGHPNGFFVGATLFDHVQPWMRVYQEEILGPVLVGLRVRTLDAALELVHSHPAAHAVSLFTRDGGVARRFTQVVQAGMVGVNVPMPAPMAWVGVGGWKASLYGGLHAGGPDGLRFFTQRKAVMQRW